MSGAGIKSECPPLRAMIALHTLPLVKNSPPDQNEEIVSRPRIDLPVANKLDEQILHEPQRLILNAHGFQGSQESGLEV